MFFFKQWWKKSNFNKCINKLFTFHYLIFLHGWLTKLSYWIFFPFCISGILEHDNEDQNLTLFSPQNWIFYFGRDTQHIEVNTNLQVSVLDFKQGYFHHQRRQIFNYSGQLSKFNQYFTPRILVNFIEF